MAQLQDDPLPPKHSPAFLPGELTKGERFWKDHYEWLLGHGIQLRPRYRPDWKPSWGGSKKKWHQCEDGISPDHGLIMDACRVSDGSFLTLKRVNKTLFPYEAEIGRFFSSDTIQSDARNHCVPIHDVLQVPDDDDFHILVMPLLRSADNPRFDTIGEAVEFFRQVFEGLQFMHAHNVAHRDTMILNIMMDASPLFPEPYHPVRQNLRRNFRGKAKHYTRTQKPVKYYFIDFGLSRKYSPEARQSVVEPIIMGGDKSAPEFSTVDACDPFPTDVYTIGNMVKLSFTEGSVLSSVRHGFDFMKPLVADMTQDDPTERPTMDEVVERFETIRKGLSSWTLRTRVVKESDSYFFGFFRTISHWIRRTHFVIRRVPPLPTPS